MIGRTLGNFRIIEQIGAGGMATVYKAYDPDTERYVAIKVLSHQFANNPQFRQRFQREAKAIAQLEHLHILPLFTYGEEDGIAYMVMRYLEAGTLSERIGRDALPLNEAAHLLTQIASALEHAHTHNVLHRDIKPGNVLLDDAGNVYLTDFGIAKMVEATLDLTGNQMLGTPAYMSPEQCRGEKDLTPASDIYALGVVLYEMITGQRPFDAETPVAVILKQLNDPLPPPRTIRPDLPPAAEAVIFKAMAKNPASRYESATAMAAAFSKAITTAPRSASVQYIDHTEVILPPVTPDEKRSLPAWTWGLIGALSVIALITIGFIGGLFPDAQEIPLVVAITETATRPLPPATSVITKIPTLTPVPEIIYTITPAVTSTDEPAVEPLPIVVPVSAPILRAGAVLFSDDFEDGDADGWELNTEGGGNWGIVQDQSENFFLRGEHIIGEGAGHDIYAIVGDTSWQNYALELRFRMVDIDPQIERELTFNVRNNQTRSGCKAYSTNFFNIDTIIARVGDEACSVSNLYRTDLELRSDIQLERDTWYDFRIESYGTHFQVFLNEEKIFQIDDAEADIWSGNVQLILGGGAMADFDDIRVTELTTRPTCGPGEEELFFDDFEDGNALGWDFWTVTGGESRRATKEDWHLDSNGDNYFLVANVAGGIASTIFPLPSPDYAFQIHVRLDSSPENNPILNINIRGSEGHWYLATLGSLVREYSDEEPNMDYLFLPWRRWQYEPDNVWHVMRVAAVGNQIALHWDDELVAELKDPNPVTGLNTLLENVSGTFWYDDILVCDLSQLAEQREIENVDNVLFVDARATTGGDGSQATPFNRIQDAIDRVASDNVIRVASGTYDENLQIQSQAITIEGGYDPETWIQMGQPSDTILDGGGRDIAVSIGNGAHVVIDNLTIANGHSACINQPGGGGISILDAETQVTIQQSIIRDNLAESPCGGGGIEAHEASIIVLNSWIVDNIADNGAGINMMKNSHWVVYNTTIANNQSQGIDVNNDSGATGHVINSIIWGNDGGDVVGQLINAVSVLSTDPLFVDPVNSDYHLQPTSSAIDRGITTGAPFEDIDGDTRPFGNGVDIGADEFSNSE